MTRPEESMIMNLESMLDITGAQKVEIEIRADGKVVWVNVDDVCRLRVCRIEGITINDYREV
jgi:hypothetical protein